MASASSFQWFVAGAALGALGVAALGPCSRAETTPPAAPVAPAAPPRREPPEPRPDERRARGAKARPEKTIEAAAVLDAAAPRATPVVDAAADEDFPGVDVEVVGFDGLPCAGAVVYALPAGSDWTNEDGSSPPHAEAAADGRARLRVVHRGRYDVGAVSGALQTLATDVDVPRTDALRLALPAPAEVVVRFDPTIDAKRPPVISVQTDSDADSPWPGRAGRQSWLGQATSGTDTRFALPRGTPFWVTSVGGDSDHVRIEPARGVAPAEVRVSPDLSFYARLRFVFAPEGASFPHPYALHVEVAAGEGADERTRCMDVAFAASAPAKTDASLLFLLPSDAGAIRWKGEGVLPGSTTYAGLRRDRVDEIALHVRLAADAPRPTPDDEVAPEDRKIRRTFHVEPAGDPRDAAYAVLCRPDGSVFSAEGFDTLSGTGAKWALVRRGEWTAAPIDVGPGDDGDVAFTLRRGGFLVVVPEGRLPPESLGPVTIARKDGLPMFAGGDADCAVRAEFAPGLVLGPSLEGPTTFVVRIGDEIVAETSAVVRAGGYEPLRIPKIRGR